jgi:hypothetical protein
LSASRQAVLFGSFPHAANKGWTSISLPPTACFSFVQLAADGHVESPGRARCLDRVAATAAAKPSDKSGSAAKVRNKFLLFI